MRRKQLKWIVAFWAVCFLVIVSMAFAQDEDLVTVRLKTGQEYKDAEIDVNDLYKTVKIEWEDEEVNVSFSDIESITNNKGEDISERVLGRYHNSDRETWLSAESEQVLKARSRPWKVLVNLGGNYSIPSGDYYDGIDAGIGFGGDIRIAVTNKIAVQCLISRSGAKVGDDVHFYPLDPNLTIISQDISLSIMRYEVAVNFYNPVSRVSEYPNYFYAFTGMGMAAHTTKFDATVRNELNGQTLNMSDSDTENKFSLVIGLGFIAKLSKNVGFDFSGTVDMIPVDAYTSSGDKTVAYAYLFDFKLGVAYMF